MFSVLQLCVCFQEESGKSKDIIETIGYNKILKTNIVTLEYIATFVICAYVRLEGLIMRFEAPNPCNRWDSPVFSVHASESLPCDQLHDVLFARQPPPPNLSTLPVSITRDSCDIQLVILSFAKT